jgi:hypothetical protein
MHYIVRNLYRKRNIFMRLELIFIILILWKIVSIMEAFSLLKISEIYIAILLILLKESKKST